MNFEEPVAIALRNLELALNAVSSLRQPNEGIHGYSLPSRELVTEFQLLISSCTKDNIVTIATSILKKVPLPTLEAHAPREHLEIYYGVASLREAADNLVQATLSHGYSGQSDIFVGFDKIAPELVQIRYQLERLQVSVDEMSGEIAGSQIDNIALTLGPVSIPLGALRGLIAAGSSIISPRGQINASALSLNLAAIYVKTKELLEAAGMLQPQMHVIADLAKSALTISIRLAGLGREVLRIAAGIPEIAHSVGELGAYDRRPVPTKPTEIAMDIGGKTIRIITAVLGIVLEEPAISSVFTENRKKSWSHGLAAAKSLGRASARIKHVRPFERGFMHDEREALGLLRSLAAKAYRAPIWGLALALISIPSRATSVDRRALKRVTKEATKAKKVVLVDESLAALLGAVADQDVMTPRIVISARASTTDVALISACEIIAWRSLKCGEVEMDAAIVSYARRHHNLLISLKMAAKLREEIGHAYDRPESNDRFEITGTDVLQGVPRSILFDNREIGYAISEQVSNIIAAVKDVITSVPAGLVGEVDDIEILLSGELAYLRGLGDSIRDHTGFRVLIPTDPEHCVAKGLLKLLSDQTLRGAISGAI